MRIQQDQRFEKEFAALPEHIQTGARKGVRQTGGRADKETKTKADRGTKDDGERQCSVFRGSLLRDGAASEDIQGSGRADKDGSRQRVRQTRG